MVHTNQLGWGTRGDIHSSLLLLGMLRRMLSAMAVHGGFCFLLLGSAAIWLILGQEGVFWLGWAQFKMLGG